MRGPLQKLLGSFDCSTFRLVGIGLKAAPTYCTTQTNGSNKRKIGQLGALPQTKTDLARRDTATPTTMRTPPLPEYLRSKCLTT